MSVEQLKEMFNEVTLKKQASKISVYYHPDFVLYANEQTMDYAHFLKAHEEIYKTDIQYKIEYDEATFLEQGDKIAGRMWITTKRGQDPVAKRIEVILIVQYKEGKIYRLWELTCPDWSKLPDFEVFSKNK